MSTAEKLFARFKQAENTFPWQSLVTLLGQLGYEKREMAGSRVRFFHVQLNHTIMLHKPHPENYIKGAALKAVKTSLLQVGLL